MTEAEGGGGLDLTVAPLTCPRALGCRSSELGVTVTVSLPFAATVHDQILLAQRPVRLHCHFFPSRIAKMYLSNPYTWLKPLLANFMSSPAGLGPSRKLVH